MLRRGGYAGTSKGRTYQRGNVHSSKYWRRVLLPVIDRYRDRPIPKYFRGDAAFAVPGLFRVLEAEDYGYAIRIKSNRKLEGKIAHLMRRPVGRPSRKPKVFYHSFQYQAGTWAKPRRIVAKVEWHCDMLFPKVGFIVTNLRSRPKGVVKFYNKRGGYAGTSAGRTYRRGKAEQWIKEGKHAINWTRLSCHDFRDNARTS